MKVILRIALILSSILLQYCNLTGVEYENGWTKGKSMTAANDSSVPDSLKILLREDAARMALRDVHSDPESRQSVIILPQELVDFYYNGLVHIYNSISLPARDTVFVVYKIHTIRRPETHSVIVAVDSTKSWVQKWRLGQRLTGNPQIDALMINYDLQLINYYDWSFLHAVVLESPKPINIYALAKRFLPIDGVLFAEENYTVGDGDDVNVVIEQEYLTVEFSKGWDDCFAGCISRRYWVFQVKFNGLVRFMRSYGNILPKAVML